MHFSPDQPDLLPVGSGLKVPLATRLRPTSFTAFAGQEQLLGKDRPLRLAIERDCVPSMVLWGPPGSGKTTIAQLIATQTQQKFLTLSAVSDGVKDIRRLVSETRALGQAPSILFVDEVHRFNKAQQDALLPHIESGLFIFIGATTENPAFELNNALLSRVAVYRLEPLSEQALRNIALRAIRYGQADSLTSGMNIDDNGMNYLVEFARGDARVLITAIESLFQFAAARRVDKLTVQLIRDALGTQALQYDKRGDHFYDQISALHKSVRGSSPDAALYWLARMLGGGCDPAYIARRLVRIASEDIGLADPRALRVALDGWEMFERLGSPEGEIGLAQAVVYLSVAAKSNSLYRAVKKSTELAEQYSAAAVPTHLRNAPNSLAKSLGHGAEYRYAHDYPDAYVPGENYLPESLQGEVAYQPSDRGLEAKIKQRLSHWAELDRAHNLSKM